MLIVKGLPVQIDMSMNTVNDVKSTLSTEQRNEPFGPQDSLDIQEAWKGLVDCNCRLRQKASKLLEIIFKKLENLPKTATAAVEKRLVSIVEMPGVDSSIRWWLLYDCISDFAKNWDPANDTNIDRWCVLVRVLLGKEPSLAFESSMTEPRPAYAEQLHSKPPFHLAAEESANRIFSIMIEYGSRYLSNYELDLYLGWKDKSMGNVLAVAAKAQCLGIIKTLLDTSLTPLDDPSVFKALMEGKQVDAIAMILQVRQDLIKNNFEGAAKTGDKDIMGLFMEYGLDHFTANVAKAIIESGFLDIWNLPSVKKRSSRLDDKGLLHCAVKNQHVNFVRILLEERQERVAEQDLRERYALWYNNHVVVTTDESSTERREHTNAKQEIRDLLAPAIIRSQESRRISEIFQKSGGTLCFQYGFPSINNSFRKRSYFQIPQLLPVWIT
jgi:hypothetical protein